MAFTLRAQQQKVVCLSLAISAEWDLASLIVLFGESSHHLEYLHAVCLSSLTSFTSGTHIVVKLVPVSSNDSSDLELS